MAFKRGRAQAVRGQDIVDAAIGSFDALINYFEPPPGAIRRNGFDKGDSIDPVADYAASTNVSITFFKPECSKSTVSFWPSMDDIFPYPNFW